MSEPMWKLSDEELASLTRAFDHHSPEYREHSVEMLDYMQRTCPFAHSPNYGGFWVATKADTVLEIAKNEAFSNFPTEQIPALEPTLMIPLNVDPPELYDYRAILNPLFSPKRMLGEREEIRAQAAKLMDAIVAEGRGDVVMDLAQPLTGMTTLRLIGIDPMDWNHYTRPLHELVYSGRPRPERLAAMAVMIERMRAEVRRQKEAPTPGSILEYLHNVEMAGRKLRIDEIDSIVLIMLGGGLDTAQALVGRIAVYLGRNPDRRQELVDNPDLMDGAVEEFLRVFPPTQGVSRRATKDIEVGGHLVKAEEQVLMSFVAANRDPDEFPDPHKVDFNRENNRHFSFGVGPHRCLGSHLARLEMTACLNALLSKAPNYKLVEEEVELAKDIGTMAGYDKVPIII